MVHSSNDVHPSRTFALRMHIGVSRSLAVMALLYSLDCLAEAAHIAASSIQDLPDGLSGISCLFDCVAREAVLIRDHPP